MNNPQLEALGILFPADEENQEFIQGMRKKYDVFFPETHQEKKRYINQWPFRTWAAVEAECLIHVMNMPETKPTRKLFGMLAENSPEKLDQAVKKSDALARRNGEVLFAHELDMAKCLAHFILRDEYLPFHKSLGGGIFKIGNPKDGVFLLALVTPFTDIKSFTAELTRKFKKTYNPPKLGAQEYLRNARYVSMFKSGFTDNQIADLEVAPRLKKLGIEEHSDEYYALLKKTKEKVRKARVRFCQQIKV